jgi:polysaccharide export outer membrane protein
VTPVFARAQEAVVRGEDRVGPGDVLRVLIWREEDLSGEFTVSQDGTVVLPKLGPYAVTGRVPDELRAELVREYQKYLRNPSIEITFLKRITVLGAVREPGLILVDPTMTVAEALALAGGTLPEGGTDRIELVRDGRRVQTVTERTRIGELSMQSGDRLFVPERSWASRNGGVVAAIITGAASVAVALILR